MLLEIVINDNNPNMLLSLVAIIAFLIVLYELITIKLNNKRLKKLMHAKKLILERHDRIEAENERRIKLNKRKNFRNSSN